LPKDFGAKRKPEAQKLQREHDPLRARSAQLDASSADQALVEEIKSNPGTTTTIQNIEEGRQRTYRALFKEMNEIACASTAINADLSRDFAVLIAKTIDEVVKEETELYKRFGCVYVESALVASLRKLYLKFQMASQKRSTGADIGGSPRVILANFFDL
jgi:hypothetical protein